MYDPNRLTNHLIFDLIRTSKTWPMTPTDEQTIWPLTWLKKQPLDLWPRQQNKPPDLWPNKNQPSWPMTPTERKNNHLNLWPPTEEEKNNPNHWPHKITDLSNPQRSAASLGELRSDRALHEVRRSRVSQKRVLGLGRRPERGLVTRGRGRVDGGGRWGRSSHVFCDCDLIVLQLFLFWLFFDCVIWLSVVFRCVTRLSVFSVVFFDCVFSFVFRDLICSSIAFLMLSSCVFFCYLNVLFSVFVC